MPGCQKPSRGWKNRQLRTNEFQRQVQSPVFGREQPHEAVLARTDWLESNGEKAEPAESWLASGKMLPASASAAETANCVLGCASNTVARQPEEVIPPLYVVVLCLHTEYHSQFWAPQYKKDAVRLEQDLEECVLLILKGGSKGEISVLSSTT